MSGVIFHQFYNIFPFVLLSLDPVYHIIFCHCSATWRNVRVNLLFHRPHDSNNPQSHMSNSPSVSVDLMKCWSAFSVKWCYMTFRSAKNIATILLVALWAGIAVYPHKLCFSLCNINPSDVILLAKESIAQMTFETRLFIFI